MKAVLLALALAAATAASATDPLEGRWEINGRGATVDIAPAPGQPGVLEMSVADSPDMSVAPGTVIGTVVPSSVTGVYDCRVSSDPRGIHHKRGTVAFTIEFADDTGDAVRFNYYRHRRRVSLWRWIPYLFRVAVVSPAESPANLDGARRAGSPDRYIVL